MAKMIVTGKILFILMLLLLKDSGQVQADDEVEEKQTFHESMTLNLPKSYKIDWMKSIDNNKLISAITIPGAHDALALHGGALAKCQSLSLEDQLLAGIRYLDLRVSGENLEIKHGITYQHITFPEVLSKIKAFLSKYKTETVLVRVKPVRNFRGKVQNLIQNIINNDDVWIKNSIPKIGEVRGKVVLVQKDRFTLGIPLSGTDNKGDYKVTNINHKKEIVALHLMEAANKCKNNDHDEVVLSYSSGTGVGTSKGLSLFPSRVAKEINPWLYEYLKMQSVKKPKPCYGIIAMDFPGFDLIQMVIKFNT
ncbi:1-phosphatidylinositol phosphodiesterase-like [Myxocyprinus asiaticus]|uniref:1-phosphatidylinositol phosphodiesterase-like n=1 Tax=Myxocyprinus asiaticus TaxID=70543 RepID=UPI002222E1FA|nr:1-phosphatidylinositol phosphodiesterase-like [Myxocyprinus asiaticus]XP_051575401.1 1-phosphatidylinositol phosphodiesterase-like [Myxocyprinus asiaticus]